MIAITILLVIAAWFGGQVHQKDVMSAFLNGEFEEEGHMNNHKFSLQKVKKISMQVD